MYDLAGDGDPRRVTDQQLEGAGKVAGMALSIFYCPSRRPADVHAHFDRLIEVVPKPNARMPEFVGKLDYAASAGEIMISANPGPTVVQGMDGSSDWCNDPLGNPINACASPDYRHIGPLSGVADFSGVIFRRSEVGIRHVSDGTAHTYLIGEKYVNPLAYERKEPYLPRDGDILDWGDLYAWTAGCDDSGFRAGFYPPQQDRAGLDNRLSFGSAHSAGFHMSFCDGSVRVIEYGIDPMVHLTQANRRDGLAVR